MLYSSVHCGIGGWPAWKSARRRFPNKKMLIVWLFPVNVEPESIAVMTQSRYLGRVENRNCAATAVFTCSGDMLRMQRGSP